jgi:hypothetical protein
MSVPIPIVVGVICLGLGMAGGVLLGQLMPEQEKPPGPVDRSGGGGMGDAKKGGPPGDGGGKKGPGPGAKGPGGKGPGGGGGGFPAPSSKLQLAQLVTKLDVLTARPLAVQLTPDQKKQAAELLAGVGEKEELTEAEAREKLEAIQKLLDEEQTKTLRAAGYPPGPFGGKPPANPFRTGDAAERLKSLQATLGK